MDITITIPDKIVPLYMQLLKSRYGQDKTPEQLLVCAASEICQREIDSVAEYIKIIQSEIESQKD